jgi:hypothetical protein
MEKSGMGRRVTELAARYPAVWRGVKENLNPKGH